MQSTRNLSMRQETQQVTSIYLGQGIVLDMRQ